MKASYLRGYKDPHRTIRAVSVAARALPGLRVIRVPMHAPSSCYGALPSPLLRLWGKFFGHLLLCRRICRIRAETIVVREFLTLPLLLVSPWLLKHRERVWFLCHHNIAFASKRVTHRWALRLLSLLGYRFVVFEDRSLWRSVSRNFNPRCIATLPCPIIPLRPEPSPNSRDAARPLVGFIGNPRAEKSSDWAIQMLLDHLAKAGTERPFEILIGTSDQAFRAKWGARATTLDTKSYPDYLRALEMCNVIVLPYDPSAYAYRVSGVLSEAVASGCAVVVPAIPGLTQQISVPGIVGSRYEMPGDLPQAVISALHLSRTRRFQSAVKAHRLDRGPKGLSKALQELCKNADTSR